MSITLREPFRRSSYRVAVLLLACAIVPALTARAQDSKSAAAAKELAQALDGAKLDAIAAADPAAPGTFVAALYIPGSQFLVVSAKYAVPALMTDRIAKKDYREVYIDLTAASVAGTKIFAQDMNVNGLQSKANGDDQPDTWEEGGKTITFDGDWKKSKLASEAEYAKAFGDADARLVKILGILLAEVKKSS